MNEFNDTPIAYGHEDLIAYLIEFLITYVHISFTLLVKLSKKNIIWSYNRSIEFTTSSQ